MTSDVTNDLTPILEKVIVCCGTNQITDINQTGETLEFELLELAEYLASSCNEFGYDDAIIKGWELIKREKKKGKHRVKPKNQ